MYKDITDNFKIRNRKPIDKTILLCNVLIVICLVVGIVAIGWLTGLGIYNKVQETRDLEAQIDSLQDDVLDLEYNLYNQVQYSIILNEIIEYWGYETITYQDFLENYLYPNGELNQELHNKYKELGY